MSNRATSLEPKSQLAINLALRRKQNKKKESSRSRIERKQRKKIPNQKRGRKQKKERKFPIKHRKKIEEIYRKVFGPDNIWTIQNCHQVNKKKKGNHDLKWSSPFDCQPKSCALATFSPRTKQKQKRKRQEHSKPHSPQENKPFPRKSPIDPWSRM